MQEIDRGVHDILGKTAARIDRINNRRLNEMGRQFHKTLHSTQAHEIGFPSQPQGQITEGELGK